MEPRRSKFWSYRPSTANLEAVLVLKSMQFEVSRGQMGFEGFLVNVRSQSDLLLRCHLVFTLCFLCVAFVNMNDLIHLY